MSSKIIFLIEKYSCKVIFLSVLLYISLFCSIALAKSDKSWTCTENDKIIGPCFKVHGRLSVFNGNPPIRIWPVGTKHLLGVSVSEFETGKFPAFIQPHIKFGTRIYGDFVVCPLTESKPGHMQNVCINSCSNVVIERFIEGKDKSEVFKLKDTWENNYVSQELFPKPIQKDRIMDSKSSLE